MSGEKKILIAPLNWGLGHATRCIPIIKYLLSLDYKIIL
ncbi:MAG: glycosyltransferase, partial [Bacteroidota bacterium]